jgi:hypothetical protein
MRLFLQLTGKFQRQTGQKRRKADWRNLIQGLFDEAAPKETK